MRPLVAAVKSLVDAFPHRNVTDDTLYQYVEDLEDLPEPLVCEAIKRLRRTSTFLPTIAEIRGLVTAAVMPPETSIGDATRLIQRQINAHSTRFEDVAFDDPCVMEAVQAVGWRRICLEDRSKGDYVTRDLEAALKAAQERRRRGVQDGTQGVPAALGRPEGARTAAALERGAA